MHGSISYPRCARNPRPPLCGFTLLELLVVISVITLLISIILPAFEAARARAQAVQCLANVRQIGSAAHLYSLEYSHYIGWSPAADRKTLLYPYIGHGRSNDDVGGDQVWHCPSNNLLSEQASFGFNPNLNFVAIDRVAQPSATVALCDAGINDTLGSTLATHCFPPSRASFPGIGRPNPRHPGSAPSVSVSFVDGHAQSQAMMPPFYPDLPGLWTGNSILDPAHPQYQDELWDLQ